MNGKDYHALDELLNDAVSVPKAYVRLCNGDWHAAAMLAQIRYWMRIGKDGSPRAKMERDGFRWIIRNHGDWKEELDLSAPQAKRSAARLLDLGLIITQQTLFGGRRSVMYRSNDEAIAAALIPNGTKSSRSNRTNSSRSNGTKAHRSATSNSVNPSGSNGTNPNRSSSNRETTTQTTVVKPAGDGDAVPSAPHDANGAATAAGQSQHPELMAALCRAAGLSVQDLTEGTRGELDKLADRIAREPRETWPDSDQLVVIYQAELDELGARLRREVKSLNMSQFRQAVGAWFARQARQAEELKTQAERAARQTELEAELSARVAVSTPAPTDATESWERVARGLRHSMSPASWDAWVKPIAPLALEDGVLAVEVATPMIQDWIEQRIGDQLKTLTAEAGVELRIMVHGAAREAVPA